MSDFVDGSSEQNCCFLSASRMHHHLSSWVTLSSKSADLLGLVLLEGIKSDFKLMAGGRLGFRKLVINQVKSFQKLISLLIGIWHTLVYLNVRRTMHRLKVSIRKQIAWERWAWVYFSQSYPVEGVVVMLKRQVMFVAFEHAYVLHQDVTVFIFLRLLSP